MRLQAAPAGLKRDFKTLARRAYWSFSDHHIVTFMHTNGLLSEVSYEYLYHTVTLTERVYAVGTHTTYFFFFFLGPPAFFDDDGSPLASLSW